MNQTVKFTEMQALEPAILIWTSLDGVCFSFITYYWHKACDICCQKMGGKKDMRYAHMTETIGKTELKFQWKILYGREKCSEDLKLVYVMFCTVFTTFLGHIWRENESENEDES